jgi:hypothetical protein
MPSNFLSYLINSASGYGNFINSQRSGACEPSSAEAAAALAALDSGASVSRLSNPLSASSALLLTKNAQPLSDFPRTSLGYSVAFKPAAAAPSTPRVTPNASLVWQALLQRSTFTPRPTATPTNALLVTWISYFLYELAHTVPGTVSLGVVRAVAHQRAHERAAQDGCASFAPPEGPNLKRLYGMTPAREALLRTHTGGRMLTSSVNGVEMAPLWSSVPNLTMW